MTDTTTAEPTAAPSQGSSGQPQEAFALTTSRGFPEWLAGQKASIAFTTYQAGKIFMLGAKADGKLSIFERTFARCMGLAASQDARKLALATHYQVYRFDNVIPEGGVSGGHDALYAPRVSWITGDVDAHDIAFDADGKIVFVNTLFSCLAEISEGYSFKPIWQPPFISKLAPEDRCHMNGLAMEFGRPRYVTMVSASDVADGWRDRRDGGGMVMDVTTNERVLEGLSMPHSPRVHDGRLWLLNSGAGQLGYYDEGSKAFVPVAFCPGYARGLSFIGKYALVGLSQARENRTFSGLPLDKALADRDAVARCGILVIDTESGDTVEWVRIEGVVKELFDVVALPAVRNPSIIGLITDDVRRVISIDEG